MRRALGLNAPLLQCYSLDAGDGTTRMATRGPCARGSETAVAQQLPVRPTDAAQIRSPCRSLRLRAAQRGEQRISFDARPDPGGH